MSFSLIARLFASLAFVLLGQTPVPPAVSPPEPAPKVWGYADYRIVAVRVHLLRETDVKAAGTTLTESDIARIFRKANGIWHQAGVHLRLESVVSEKTAIVAGYEHADSIPIEGLKALRPVESHPDGMFHVYYMGTMPPNGIYMGRDAIFVKETARLHPVPGGIDEPLPRVTAHELGHGMGLPHRQNTTNLLASGTTGTSLNEAEVDTVRKTLEKFAWVETPEECLKKAETLLKVGDKPGALSHLKTLLELPASEDMKAKIRVKIGDGEEKPAAGPAGTKGA